MTFHNTHCFLRLLYNAVHTRNVPLTILLIGVTLRLVGLLDGTFPVMFMSGMLVSWVYLRFYQRHGVSSRGDSSDSFSFARYTTQCHTCIYVVYNTTILVIYSTAAFSQTSFNRPSTVWLHRCTSFVCASASSNDNQPIIH